MSYIDKDNENEWDNIFNNILNKPQNTNNILINEKSIINEGEVDKIFDNIVDNIQNESKQESKQESKKESKQEYIEFTQNEIEYADKNIENRKSKKKYNITINEICKIIESRTVKNEQENIKLKKNIYTSFLNSEISILLILDILYKLINIISTDEKIKLLKLYTNKIVLPINYKRIFGDIRNYKKEFIEKIENISIKDKKSDNFTNFITSLYVNPANKINNYWFGERENINKAFVNELERIYFEKTVDTRTNKDNIEDITKLLNKYIENEKKYDDIDFYLIRNKIIRLFSVLVNEEDNNNYDSIIKNVFKRMALNQINIDNIVTLEDKIINILNNIKNSSILEIVVQKYDNINIKNKFIDFLYDTRFKNNDLNVKIIDYINYILNTTKDIEKIIIILNILNKEIDINKNIDNDKVKNKLFEIIYEKTYKNFDKIDSDDLIAILEFTRINNNSNNNSNNIKIKKQEDNCDNERDWISEKYVRLIRYFKIPVNEYFKVNEISSDSTVEELEWWFRSGLFIKYNEIVVDLCYNIDVLEWWLNKGLNNQLIFKYSEDAIYNACSSNNIKLMDWWYNVHKNTKYKLKYDSRCMDYATNINVLEWWFNKKDEIELKYTKNAFENAVILKNINDDSVYLWWVQSRLKIPK